MLKLVKRGNNWHVRGRLESSGESVRRSLGTSDEAVAKAKLAQIEREDRKRAILGEDAPDPRTEVTFAEIVPLYQASDYDARCLIKLLPHIGKMRVSEIRPTILKNLGQIIYPNTSTDTWYRKVVCPARQVVNNAYQMGVAEHPLVVKPFTAQERVRQDRLRGQHSRAKKRAGNHEWLNSFRKAALTTEKRRGRHLAALYGFLFTSGTRITQALDIHYPDDVNLTTGEVYLPPCKGLSGRWIMLSDMTLEDLRLLQPTKGRLFGYSSRQNVRRAALRVCERAGLEYLTTHEAGRHGYATELMVRKGMDAVTVAEGQWASPSLLHARYAHAEDAQERKRAAFRTKLTQGESKRRSK